MCWACGVRLTGTWLWSSVGVRCVSGPVLWYLVVVQCTGTWLLVLGLWCKVSVGSSVLLGLLVQCVGSVVCWACVECRYLVCEWSLFFDLRNVPDANPHTTRPQNIPCGEPQLVFEWSGQHLIRVIGLD